MSSKNVVSASLDNGAKLYAKKIEKSIAQHTNDKSISARTIEFLPLKCTDRIELRKLPSIEILKNLIP